MTDISNDDLLKRPKGVPNPQRRFFGRRKAKTLSPLQKSLYHKAQNDLFFDHTSHDPFKALFDGSYQKIILEIGFGGGEHLVHQAKTYPENRYIGVDAFVNGVSKIIKSIYQHDLKNIHLSDQDALEILNHIPENSLDGVYLLYPDPWPKKRHRDRRFVQKDTAQLIQKALKPNGFFRFASDIPAYVEWTMATLTHTTNAYIDIQQNPDIPLNNWISTRYEQKALREGRTPQYYQYLFNQTT